MITGEAVIAIGITSAFIIMPGKAEAELSRDYCKRVMGDSYGLMGMCMRGEEEAKGRLK